MSRSARLLILLQALRRHRRPVTAEVLAAELGVSVRTIYRDIATLQGQGVTVEGEAGLGYVLRAGTFLPPLVFADAELDALVLGLRFVVARADEDLARAARDALAKIEAVVPPAQADARGAVGLVVSPTVKAGASHLGILRQAMDGEMRVRLAYEDKKGAATTRVIWPVAVGFFEGAEVVAAWCELRADFRHFRLDRIRTATPTGTRFPRSHRILLAEWRAGQDLDDLF